MSSIKTIKFYLFWTILSLVLGIGYMLLLMGSLPTDESFGGTGFILKVFYLHGIAFVGLPVGGIIALLFIVVDVFYLKKKLITNPYKSSFRFTVLLAIAMLIAVAHYILEKIIDVI